MTTIAILGLGEAGRHYARGLLRAGAEVRGYDPHHVLGDPDVRQLDDLADALAGAEVVVSLVGGQAAASVARDALPLVPASAVYADLNTAAPELKQEIGALASARGIAMADVAVLAPVPRAAHRTPLLASGAGAVQLAERLAPFGVPITVIDGGPGQAARLRLLRSVFMKGLAALVIEADTAAQAAGADGWLRGQMAAEFGPDGEALIERLLTGTRQHAVRREHEVREALATLEATGAPADMTRATLAWFERIVADRQS
jgi:3-hydroxyisobutyrate dehydrogenase-like beta-hydroxyacid dehydrogenase